MEILNASTKNRWKVKAFIKRACVWYYSSALWISIIGFIFRDWLLWLNRLVDYILMNEYVYTNFGSVPVINYTFILWKNTEPGAFHPTNNFWFDDKNFKLISSSERKLFSLSTGKGIKYECKGGMPKQVNIVYRRENILRKNIPYYYVKYEKYQRLINWVKGGISVCGFFCVYHKLFFIYLQNLFCNNTFRAAIYSNSVTTNAVYVTETRRVSHVSSSYPYLPPFVLLYYPFHFPAFVARLRPFLSPHLEWKR